MNQYVYGTPSAVGMLLKVLLAVVNLRHAIRIRDLTREMLDMYAPLPSTLTEPIAQRGIGGAARVTADDAVAAILPARRGPRGTPC